MNSGRCKFIRGCKPQNIITLDWAPVYGERRGGSVHVHFLRCCLLVSRLFESHLHSLMNQIGYLANCKPVSIRCTETSFKSKTFRFIITKDNRSTQWVSPVISSMKMNFSVVKLNDLEYRSIIHEFDLNPSRSQIWSPQKIEVCI